LTYEVKTWLQDFTFQMQLVPLQRGRCRRQRWRSRPSLARLRERRGGSIKPRR
jgi:hypothetical protein